MSPLPPEALDATKCQVFLLYSPSNLPFSFASHPWFVLNQRGTVSRWEVLFRTAARPESWGHVHKNFFPPFSGIEMVPFLDAPLWKGRLRADAEGELAERMCAFIERSPESYPYRDRYFLTGPNSNTYAAWVLNAFPEFPGRLAGNAFGSSFKAPPQEAAAPAADAPFRP